MGIKGQAHTGDAYSNDWIGGPIGISHMNDGIEVEKGEKALIRNKFGGKDLYD